MVLVKDYTDCSTAGLEQLDQQIIAQMYLLDPILVRFDDLAVSLGNAVHPFLQPYARGSLELVIAAGGESLTITSAYRTVAQQFVLREHANRGRCGISVAALPGSSNHQSGVALDVPFWGFWEPAFRRENWSQLPFDLVHFDYQGRKKSIEGLSVLAFQRLWNLFGDGAQLVEDGVYGPMTAQALSRSPVNGFSGAPGEATLEIAFRVLREGALGLDVQLLQKRLQASGFSLSSDGVFGPSTKRLLAEYQDRNGLLPDGVFGPVSAETLQIEWGPK